MEEALEAWHVVMAEDVLGGPGAYGGDPIGWFRGCVRASMLDEDRSAYAGVGFMNLPEDVNDEFAVGLDETTSGFVGH